MAATLTLSTTMVATEENTDVQAITVFQEKDDFQDGVNQLLRPTEFCTHSVRLSKIRKDGEHRVRIVGVIVNNKGGHEACLMVFKRRHGDSLIIEDILPIYSDFRLTMTQSTPVNLNSPGSIEQSKGGFVLKVSSNKSNEVRFECADVQHLHGLLVEIKTAMAKAGKRCLLEAMGYLSSGKTHAWKRYYEQMRQDTLQSADGALGVRPSSAYRINSSVSNPFISHESNVSANILKSIKDSWAAQELRKREMQFSDYSKLKLCVGSWNVNGRLASESLVPWLGSKEAEDPDMYILGFQEVDLSTEVYIIGNNNMKEEEWSTAIEAALVASRTDKYIKIASKQLIGMLMIVYIRRSLYPFLHDVSTESVGTGILGMMGNKGAVGIRLKLFDSYLCFVNAHLAADTSMVDRRNQDYQEICRRLSFPLQSHFKNYIAYAQANAWVCNSMDAAPSLSGFPTGGGATMSNDNLFNLNRVLLSAFDADHLIWVGDLNYRVPISDAEAKAMIESNRLEELLNFDQLGIEQAASRCFNGFNEGQICFPPTYKYDVGTSRYDTSEKKRSPSWCDRILWFKNPLKVDDPEWLTITSYDSVQQLSMSDHKPVRAHFVAKIRKLNNEKLCESQDEITRGMDKFENEAQPDLVPDSNQVQFGNVRFMVPTTRTIEVENKGQVIAQYRFISPASDDRICKPWCYVSPSTGTLIPGGKIYIDITILVDKSTSPKLNAGRDHLEDILILHTENGKDHFITISGKWLPSSFGNPLGVLCRLARPIRSCTLTELCALYEEVEKAKSSQGGKSNITGSTGNIVDTANLAEANDEVQTNYDSPSPIPPAQVGDRLSFPRELWRIIDFIYKFGMDVDNLFLSTGDSAVTEYLRECLDTGVEFDLSVLLSDEIPENEVDTPCESPSGQSSPIPTDQLQQQTQSLTNTIVSDQSINIEELLSNLSKSNTASMPYVKLPRPRGRAVSVHSAAETLLRLLEALPEPIIPTFLHRRCVLEGYLTFAAARQIIQFLPKDHYSAFMYTTCFLREVLANYRGRGGLDEEKLARLFAPILLQIMNLDDNPKNGFSAIGVGSTIGTTNNAGASTSALPHVTGKGGGTFSPNASSVAVGLSPPKSTSSYLSSVLFGAIGGQWNSHSQQQSQQSTQQKVNAAMIGPPIPPEATSAGGIETWNRKRWMFLRHFLEQNNHL
ncbi:hypothetical protein BDEG_21807 [Batrachochytrium dendrobatidis JEL423]|uniref:Rho-GAP domain-containing protein n=1 Tax=Batrachochytrium dendrobatidis (strain JEL423) TaxID=403673 RepID=A0A177WDH1_BATDL|nr:hypothetical protein BDEG_21807 [Batrachochytrium dendrobatidis JEL423]